MSMFDDADFKLFKDVESKAECCDSNWGPLDDILWDRCCVVLSAEFAPCLGVVFGSSSISITLAPSIYIYIYHIDLYRTIYTHCAICMHPHPQISMFGGVSHTNWKTYYIYLYIHSSLHTVPLSNTGTGERLLVILEGTSSGKTCIQYLIISIYWARIYSLSCACLVPQDCGDRSPVGFWCQTGSQDISQSIAWFQIQFWIWTVNYWTWINMIILKLEKTDEQHTTWKAFSTFHMCDFMEYANIYIYTIYIYIYTPHIIYVYIYIQYIYIYNIYIYIQYIYIYTIYIYTIYIYTIYIYICTIYVQYMYNI